MTGVSFGSWVKSAQPIVVGAAGRSPWVWKQEAAGHSVLRQETDRLQMQVQSSLAHFSSVQDHRLWDGPTKTQNVFLPSYAQLFWKSPHRLLKVCLLGNSKSTQKTNNHLFTISNFSGTQQCESFIIPFNKPLSLIGHVSLFLKIIPFLLFPSSSPVSSQMLLLLQRI